MKNIKLILLLLVILSMISTFVSAEDSYPVSSERGLVECPDYGVVCDSGSIRESYVEDGCTKVRCIFPLQKDLDEIFVITEDEKVLVDNKILVEAKKIGYEEGYANWVYLGLSLQGGYVGGESSTTLTVKEGEYGKLGPYSINVLKVGEESAKLIVSKIEDEPSPKQYKFGETFKLDSGKIAFVGDSYAEYHVYVTGEIRYTVCDATTQSMSGSCSSEEVQVRVNWREGGKDFWMDSKGDVVKVNNKFTLELLSRSGNSYKFTTKKIKDTPIPVIPTYDLGERFTINAMKTVAVGEDVVVTLADVFYIEGASDNGGRFVLIEGGVISINRDSSKFIQEGSSANFGAYELRVIKMGASSALITVNKLIGSCSAPVSENCVVSDRVDDMGCPIYICSQVDCVAPKSEDCMANGDIDRNGCPIWVCEGDNPIAIDIKYDSHKSGQGNLPTKVYVKTINEGDSCEGCVVEDKCLSYGIRLKNGQASFCDLSGVLVNQKEDGADCQNNYECISNTCASGECVDLVSQVRENTSLLNKIWDWITGIF